MTVPLITCCSRPRQPAVSDRPFSQRPDQPQVNRQCPAGISPSHQPSITVVPERAQQSIICNGVSGRRPTGCRDDSRRQNRPAVPLVSHASRRNTQNHRGLNRCDHLLICLLRMFPGALLLSTRKAQPTFTVQVSMVHALLREMVFLGPLPLARTVVMPCHIAPWSEDPSKHTIR
jgi:hypothetical protein